jgi:hypothetical protein
VSMLTIEGTWRDISAAPLARAVAMTATVQTPADHVIPDEALNRILGLSRTSETDPDGLARVQVVKAPGVVYRVVFGGVVGHLRCDDWDDDTTVPFVGIKDVPGGDVEVDPLTWDAVLSGLAGRIAAQVPGAVATELDAILANPATPARVAIDAAGAAAGAAASASKITRGEAYFDPKDYGATGDGVTDDSAALQATINAAAATGGVIRARGTFNYATPLNWSGKLAIRVEGNANSRGVGTTFQWVGPDNVSANNVVNSSGIAFVGIAFTAGSGFGALISGTQQRAAHIDARCAPGQSSQTFHLTVERCFFSQTGTLAYDPTYTGSGADRTGGNCVDIATGFGHTMTIRQNNFFRSAIAIEGNDATVTPNQGTQNVLIQGNFFEPYRRVAHITDPGSGWSIRDNSVEPRFDGTAGFVRLIKNTAKGLRGVVIENNWCGDIVAPAGNTGTQIEIAGGPFVIRDNLLGMSSANLAIKAVGALTAPVIISGNRIVSYGAAPWLDWGTGLGHTTVEAWVTGNDVPEYVEGVAGTPPTMSFGYTTTSLGHTLQAPGVVLGNSKFLQFKPASAANPSLAQIYAGPDDALTALSLPDASIRFRLMGTSSTPAAGQGFEVYSWDGTGFVRRFLVRPSLTFVESDEFRTSAATKLGFYGTIGIVKPSVSGSRGGNAALASLISALAALGLVTDSTSA